MIAQRPSSGKAGLFPQEGLSLSQGFVEETRVGIFSLNDSDLRPERPPPSHGGVSEQSEGGRSEHGGQMGDAAIMTHIKAGLGQKGVKSLLLRAEKNFTSPLTETQAIDRSHFFFRRAKKKSEGQGGCIAETMNKIQPESRRIVLLPAP
jgi:hypothetical protein